MKGTLPKETSTLPRRTGKVQIESKIIKPRVIINWIERKDANYIRKKDDLRYKFDRIYQSSQSGIDQNSFRSNFKLNGPILVKCQGSHKIFGGCSPFISFDNSYYKQWIDSIGSVIFSFENDNLKNMKLQYVVRYYIVIDKCNYGYFNFGDALYMQHQQLHVNSGNNYYENNMNENNTN